MRLGAILLTLSFFVNIATGFSMFENWWNIKEQPSKGRRDYLEIGEQTAVEIKRGGRTLSDQQSASRQKNDDYSVVLTAIDPAIDMRKEEELTVDYSEDLLNQKIEEAKAMAAKWTTRIDHICLNKEEITSIFQEAEGDTEYLVAQQKKITSWVNEKNLEERTAVDLKRRELILQLSEEVHKVLTKAERVVELLIQLDNQPVFTEGVERFRGSHLNYAGDAETIREKSLNSENPYQGDEGPMNPLHLATDDDAFQGRASNNLSGITIKIPSPHHPLRAKSLHDVLETWITDAEIRYDKNAKEYKSYYSQPKGFFESMSRIALRNQKERGEHRAAIEKIAQELGTDHAVVFKNEWIVRLSETFGEPLTPKSIKLIQRRIDQNQKDETESENMLSEQHRYMADFFERIGELWRQLGATNIGHSYSQIPEISSDK